MWESALRKSLVARLHAVGPWLTSPTAAASSACYKGLTTVAHSHDREWTWQRNSLRVWLCAHCGHAGPAIHERLCADTLTNAFGCVSCMAASAIDGTLMTANTHTEAHIHIISNDALVAHKPVRTHTYMHDAVHVAEVEVRIHPLCEGAQAYNDTNI